MSDDDFSGKRIKSIERAISRSLCSFDERDKKRLENAVTKFNKTRSNPNSLFFTFDDLKRLWGEATYHLVASVLDINPPEFGVKYEFFGLLPVLKEEDVVFIRGQKYTLNGEIKKLPTKVLPKKVYEAFAKMNDALVKDTGGLRLNIYSGYQSPAYHLGVFLDFLVENDFDVGKTIKKVAPPAYSEHCYYIRQGIDFAPVQGISDLGLFDRTPHSRWMRTGRNAERHGFVLSYPKNNGRGIAYEPWHWHYDHMLL
jgi:hypothetical protein